eukprot:Skav203815  [mRNA]  locus=scaffold1236:454163:457375:- [translate_table: standard]
MQEVCCSVNEWKSTLKRWDKLGFMVYACDNVTKGLKKNGVMTIISHQLNSRPIDGFSSCQGYSVLAVEIQDILHVNSYCPPHEADLHSHAIEFEEMMIRTAWQGSALWCGDWNQLPEDGWISTLGFMLDIVPVFTEESSSRWKGTRLIDYFLSNIPHLEAVVQTPQLSDHKIFQVSLQLKLGSLKERRFKKSLKLDRPAWISEPTWRNFLQQAYAAEENKDWKEAMTKVNLLGIGHTPPDITDDSDQRLVDLSWQMFQAKYLCTIRTAFFLSLLCIPEDFEDLHEIHRVEKLSNKPQYGRMSISQYEYDKSVTTTHIPVCRRRLRNRIAQLGELIALVRKGNRNHRIGQICWKLFRCHQAYGLPYLESLRTRWESDLLQMEEQDKKKALTSWKQRIKHDVKYRADWLAKKRVSYYPQVVHGTSCSSNKLEAATLIKQFDDEMKDELYMTGSHIHDCAKEMSDYLKMKFSGINGSSPSSSELIKAIKKCGGGPGLDQWTASELKWILSLPHLLDELFLNYKIWFDTALVPASLRETKVTYIPKENKIVDGVCKVQGLRPITVLSCFWRCFSTMWLSSDILQQVHQQMPKDLQARHSAGPEVQASVVDALLSKWKHSATLDFSQCFDTINLQVIKIGLAQSLPGCLKQWSTLLCDFWMSCNRWIIYHKSVGGCLRSDIGIPQGDPCSPLILSLLLWVGSGYVAKTPFAGRLHQSIWMDDRTIVASNKYLLQDCVQRWNEFARRFMLKENPTKTQTVTPGGQKNMEVLGVIVGQPGKGFLQIDSNKKRIEKTKMTIRRIATLPSGTPKLLDLKMFARPILSYGWINGRPNEAQMKTINSSLWKAVGHLLYSPKDLRTTLAGAHLECKQFLVVKQLRLLCVRNKELERLGHNPVEFYTNLDKMVQRTMDQYGWTLTDGSYSHPKVGIFSCRDVLDSKQWKTISHKIRSSIRLFHWKKFAGSKRHEIQHQQLPHVGLERIERAKKYGERSQSHFCATIGAIMSPWVRSLQGTDQYCKRCGALNPHWDHGWTCHLNMQPPEDVLTRRFLWPTDTEDEKICDLFLKYMDEHYASLEL